MPAKRTDITKEILEELYINQNLTTEEAAEKLKIHPSTLGRYLRKYQIKKSIEQVQKRASERYFEKTGYTHPRKNPEVKEQAKRTCLGIYGYDNPLKSPEIQEKAKNKVRELYGVDNVFELDEFQKLGRQRRLEKYGDEVPARVTASIEKTKATNRERYGTDWTTQSDQMKQKTKETNLRRCGNACSIHGGEGLRKTQERIRQKYFEKWGVWREGVAMSQISLSPRAFDILSSKESFEKYLSESGKTKLQEIVEDIGATLPTVFRYIKKYQLQDKIDLYISTIEKEIGGFLEGQGVFVERTREVLEGLEIDLYSPEHQIGLEVNGEYWHSSEFKKKGYHRYKTLLAQSRGVRLIHIFEPEWSIPKRRRLIEGYLRRVFNLFAFSEISPLRVEKLSVEEGAVFVKENYLFLDIPYGDEYIGVFSGEKLALVGIFQRGSFETTQIKGWRMFEFCYNPEFYIPGEEKMVLDFFKRLHPQEGELHAYTKASKEDRALYQSLGFKLIGSSKLNYFWSKNHQVFSQKEISDKEAKKMGLYQIYDCGDSVWKMNL